MTEDPIIMIIWTDRIIVTCDDETRQIDDMVSINVNSINDLPVATNDAYSTNQDTPLVVADGSNDLMLQGTDDSMLTVTF